jgi:hypothetical protein
MKNNWSVCTEMGGTHNLSKEAAEEKFNRIKEKGRIEAVLYEGEKVIQETGYVETLL